MKAIKYIDDYTKHCSNDCEGYFHEWVTPDVARGAVRIAREELIEKACEWLTIHDSYSIPTNVLVENFRKAMEE